ncbi:MAG: hypothetical protein OXC03_04405 [Flavobacteriaceae bacterium]|nr:hypothetical protein [Flavobacteriaceae bacterium]
MTRNPSNFNWGCVGGGIIGLRGTSEIHLGNQLKMIYPVVIPYK